MIRCVDCSLEKYGGGGQDCTVFVFVSESCSAVLAQLAFVGTRESEKLNVGLSRVKRCFGLFVLGQKKFLLHRGNIHCGKNHARC